MIVQSDCFYSVEEVTRIWPKLCPGSRKPSVASVYRWISRGRNGVRLKRGNAGVRGDWLLAFAAAESTTRWINPPAFDTPTPAPPVSISHEQCERELAEMGI